MKSGIYKITNKNNKEFYIGSSIDIDRRWYEHKRQLKKGSHGNYRLQNSYDVYGEDAFAFLVLLICEPDELLYYEAEIIKRLEPQYNLAMTIERPSGAVKEYKNIYLVSPEGIVYKDIVNASEFCRKHRGIKQEYITMLYNGKYKYRFSINGWYLLSSLEYEEPEEVFCLDDFEDNEEVETGIRLFQKF